MAQKNDLPVVNKPTLMISASVAADFLSIFCCLLCVFGGLLLLGSTSRDSRSDPENRPKSVHQLVKDLRHQRSCTDRVRQAIWDRLPDYARGTLPWLLPIDADEIRRQASLDLAFLGPAASNAVPALTVALTDPSSDVRLAVMQALRQVGPGARKAVPVLLKLLKDAGYTYQHGRWGGIDLRAEVAKALGQIAPKDPSVLAGLTGVLRDSNEDVRVSAATVLAATARQTPDMVPALLQAFDRADSRSKALLIRALGEARPASAENLSVLLNCLESGEYLTQATAVEALGALRPNSPAVAARLRRLFLQSQEEQLPPRLPGFNKAQAVEMIHVESDRASRWGLHRRIICALGKIGPAAYDTVPLLVREYANRTNLLRFDAAVARWRIDGKSDDMLKLFRAGLSDPDPTTRELAVSRLGEIAGEHPEALPLLTEALHDPTGRIRVQAIELLSAQGTNAGPAVSILRGLQADTSYAVRRAATNAVSAIELTSLAPFRGTL